MTATCLRQDDALVFTGPLDRAAAAALWPQLHAAIAGVRRFDLTAVPRVDSAGLALLAELAAMAGGGIVLQGRPEGLDELRAAYRLQDDLSFAS
ncbi:STAS domain-containing protein [Lysobacter solisilvae (ex Woo and Kim 2020)]|uniref:STAS domain-containing protein n=1 Tax=Agrilutibacter terrestris TaxID=2865112 RepID=A0A7H0FTN2_9GAMM|nr:STAS domain-containing protein [Lysobacter terrestris]QNP39398.1 STAS domain-containing protein [Lysobacter terrestris]